MRGAVGKGERLPAKLLHSLEVIGAAAQGVPFAEPTPDGVGCSPAATATWLGDHATRANHHPLLSYLEAVQHFGGGVPVRMRKRAMPLVMVGDVLLVIIPLAAG